MTKSKGKILNRKKINLSETHKENIKKGMQGKNKAKDNPAWKGGISGKYAINIRKGLPQICNRCGSNENIEIHHKDLNPKNNNLDNLEILCRHCHRLEHIENISPFSYKKGENHRTRKKLLEVLKDE